ncbi:hypothetical protein E9993_13330 [Labilibacter sediminis]|nr:hypothetical protein E9993_13330 [Labilibacter sediminis]
MEKELQLLHQRLHKIEERGFDLISWKAGTIAVLDSILGPDNLKRKLIEEIDFQNSSWSLRDTTGDVDSVKKICADIMETIIMEVETLGIAEKIVPDHKEEVGENFKMIEDAIRKELSQSQMDELLDLLRNEDVNHTNVMDKIKRFGYEVGPKIVASIILNPNFKKQFIR